MSKTLIIAKILNGALLLLLLASIGGFLSFANIYGVFLALVTGLLAWGVFENYGKAYFAAAAWGLACFQLAKQGYEFQAIKHYVMPVGMLIIPIAIFLHEILGKGRDERTRKSDTHEQNDRDLSP